MFAKDNMKYKVAFWRGRMCVCRVCSFKQSKHKVVRHINGKFVIVQLSLTERLKEFFRR
jgi:hypothetical protein